MHIILCATRVRVRCMQARDNMFALPKGCVRAVPVVKTNLGDKEGIERRKYRNMSSRERNKINVVEITRLGARARCAR